MDGSELREIREKVGLTQIEFADRLGVHPISLSRFERDREPITLTVELAVCELKRRLRSEKRAPRKLATKKKLK